MTLFLGRQQCINYHSTAKLGAEIDLKGLKLGDRLGDCSTVVGNITDNNGQEYIVAVLDAKYRGKAFWGGVIEEDTLLPNYSIRSEVLKAQNIESSTFNTDTILNNYNPDDYPAFKLARNAGVVTVNGKVYESQLPNINTLAMIQQNKEFLDTCDPTLSDYTENSLTLWKMGALNPWCHSSNEYNLYNTWHLDGTGWYNTIGKYFIQTTSTIEGVIPIFEIPL